MNSPPNEAPTLTVTSPSGGATIREDAQLTLSATATDPEDGDLTQSIKWTSSLGGALTPDQAGKVSLEAGAHVLTASVTDSAGLTASASVNVTVTAIPSFVVADGRRLHLYQVSETAMVERGVAEIPAAGTLDGHQIFNVLQHPIKPWLYTVSLNECSKDESWCWGNARIDRFVITTTSIAHDGVAFVYDASSSIPCAMVDSGYPGQVGKCAPVGMAFNADGSRLFVQDDKDDNVNLFAIDPTVGSATFLDLGASTYLHGLALSPAGQYLYNGSSVIQVNGDDIASSEVSSGNGGNATQLFSLNNAPFLLTTSDTDGLSVYSLASPAEPEEVSSLGFASNSVRDLALSGSGTRIIAVGKDAVRTIGFDGATLSVEDEKVQSTEDSPSIQNRSVALAAGDSRAIVGWFKFGPNGTRAGGVTVYGIGTGGELSEQETLTFSGEVRVVRALHLP